MQFILKSLFICAVMATLCACNPIQGLHARSNAASRPQQLSPAAGIMIPEGDIFPLSPTEVSQTVVPVPLECPDTWRPADLLKNSEGTPDVLGLPQEDQLSHNWF